MYKSNEIALSKQGKERLGEELDRQQKSDCLVKQQCLIANKGKSAQFQRYCYDQQVELDSLRNAHLKNANGELRVAMAKDTEDFAFEMNRIKNEEFKDNKRRQQLRETCPELRELQRYLNAAYANKIVAQQIKAKEATKKREKILEMENAERCRQAHISETEQVMIEKAKKLESQQKYKKELQDQMIYVENNIRSRYEEFLVEKKLIDELVQRIQMEDERELQKKYCDKLQMQDDIRKFKESQQIWRAKAKERLEKEDTQIQEFIRNKIAMEKKLREAKASKAEAKDRISEEMALRIYTERRKQSERAEIISEVLEAEERESHERKHREALEKEFRIRLEVHSGLTAQMEEKMEMKRQEVARDTQYKEELLQSMIENERLEQLTKEKRRIKMMQLRRDLEETMKANRYKRAMDIQLQTKADNEAKEEAEKRMKLIEEERIRMIREHAAKLIGYLPTAVLSPTPIEALGTDLALTLKCSNV